MSEPHSIPPVLAGRGTTVNPGCARRRALFLALGLVALSVAAGFVIHSGIALPVCGFKRFTGAPCFTCGATRALAALGHGHGLEALRWNPLVTGTWIILFLASVLEIVQPRFVAAARTRLPRFSLWTWMALAAVAGLVNWLYLLRTLPR
jgi:hypothetical protein